MEFVLSLDSLLCPHTIGSGQEQKVDCSNPRARSDPNGESEPKLGDARFISFYFSCN